MLKILFQRKNKGNGLNSKILDKQKCVYTEYL